MRIFHASKRVQTGPVHAVGNAASSGQSPPPVASHDAEVVAASMLDGNHKQPDYAGTSEVKDSV